MNERIRELALEADEYCRNYVPNWTMNNYNLKFAELMVQECCKEITYASVGSEDPVFAYTYISHLRKTFDVES